MVKKVRVGLLFFATVLVVSVGAASFGDQCADDFQKVTSCLTFATGKAPTPTKDCCSGVTEIKASRPVCLCYVIQQIHNGTNPQIKNYGIQEAKLLQLPSACKLANASVSDCPKLLNIPPTSPDYAIFTNSSATTAPPTTPIGTSSPATTTGGSDGFKHGPQLAVSMAIAMAVLFSVFPAGSVSTY